MQNKLVTDLVNTKAVPEMVTLLGHSAKDKVTKLFGIITSVSFDLDGKVRVLIVPEGIYVGGSISSGNWVSITRLTELSISPRVSCDAVFTV